MKSSLSAFLYTLLFFIILTGVCNTCNGCKEKREYENEFIQDISYRKQIKSFVCNVLGIDEAHNVIDTCYDGAWTYYHYEAYELLDEEPYLNHYKYTVSRYVGKDECLTYNAMKRCMGVGTGGYILPSTKNWVNVTFHYDQNGLSYKQSLNFKVGNYSLYNDDAYGYNVYYIMEQLKTGGDVLITAHLYSDKFLWLSVPMNPNLDIICHCDHSL